MIAVLSNFSPRRAGKTGRRLSVYRVPASEHNQPAMRPRRLNVVVIKL
jgi:hypothetical protein